MFSPALQLCSNVSHKYLIHLVNVLKPSINLNIKDSICSLIPESCAKAGHFFMKGNLPKTSVLP